MFRFRGHVLVIFPLADEKMALGALIGRFYWVFISIEGHQDVTPNVVHSDVQEYYIVNEAM